jgi:hypothetical protein
MALNINYVKDILIAELSKNPSFYNLPPAAKIALNAAVEAVSNTSSVQINRQVQSYSNSTINNAPRTIIGPNNQYNITTGNLSSTELSNRLTPNATNQLLGGLANDLTFNLINDLNNRLPPALRNIVNVDAVTRAISTASLPAVTRGISASVGQTSTNIMSGNFKITSLFGDVGSIAQLFAANPSGALGKVQEQFTTAAIGKAIQAAQKFNVNSPENKEKLITQTKGFIDPNAEYPTKDYKGQPDTNKLARGDINGTIVQQKENERLKGIQLPNGQSFEEPPVSYKAQYPYNKVTETESGHIIEIDDTSGAERIHVYHKSGTYLEIDPNGSIIKRAKGSSYEIVDKNGYISITGDASVSVKGSVKVYVGGDADIEVEGDVNLKSFNDITMQAAGRVDISATEEINFHSANINIEADVNLNMKGDINAFLTTKDYYVKANNNSYHEVLKNAYVKTGESLYTQTTQSAYLKTGQSVFNQAGGSIHNKSSGSFNADGSQVYLNSGTSSTSQDSVASKYSNSANIGLIGERRDVVYTTIPDPQNCNYLDEAGLKGEDSLSTTDTNSQHQYLKNLGVATGQDLDDKAIVIDRDSPTSPNSTVIKPDESLLKMTYLPDNYQLSKHFTLGDLSSKSVVSKYKVEPQNGLSYGQLVYNLSSLALNVLEPALALYPKLQVNSAFRTTAASNPSSQHTKGQAVDIQIPGLGKDQYFAVAKKLANNLNYDQLLLEYKNYGTGQPWIHISFSVDSQRKQVLTLYNDKTFSQGLSSLA